MLIRIIIEARMDEDDHSGRRVEADADAAAVRGENRGEQIGTSMTATS
jgi:hypothetical protein